MILYVRDYDMKTKVKRVTVHAKNINLALIKAAGELGTTCDVIEHTVHEVRSGFCGFGKKVVIEAWRVEQSSRKAKKERLQKKQTQRSSARERRGAPLKHKAVELSAEETQKLIERLKVYLAEMLRHAFGITSDISAEEVEFEGQKRLVFDIASPYLAKLTQSNPGLLEAFEHLLKKSPKEIKQRLPFMLYVDACSVRKNHEDQLYAKAQQMLQRVLQSSESVSLKCKNAYDRKIIHTALGEDDRVQTRSVGKGESRKLVISPVR